MLYLLEGARLVMLSAHHGPVHLTVRMKVHLGLLENLQFVPDVSVTD